MTDTPAALPPELREALDFHVESARRPIVEAAILAAVGAERDAQAAELARLREENATLKNQNRLLDKGASSGYQIAAEELTQWAEKCEALDAECAALRQRAEGLEGALDVLKPYCVHDAGCRAASACPDLHCVCGVVNAIAIARAALRPEGR